jgi:hypothetical protein
MGVATRFAGGGGIRRLFIRIWLFLVGVIGVVCALIAIPAYPGDHSTADTFHRAALCPVGAPPSPDCISWANATVKSATSTYHPGTHTGTGTGHSSTTRGSYETRITLAPLPGQTATTARVVTLTTPGPVADELPAGTQLQITMWRDSIITFQALGGEHATDADPDSRESRDKYLLAIGLPVGVLMLWLLMLSVFGARVRRGLFLAVDGALVVLAAVTVATALAGVATVASIAGAATLVVLAAGWVAARLGLLG